VQVGYFSNDVNAGNLLRKLTAKGYPRISKKMMLQISGFTASKSASRAARGEV